MFWIVCQCIPFQVVNLSCPLTHAACFEADLHIWHELKAQLGSWCSSGDVHVWICRRRVMSERDGNLRSDQIGSGRILTMPLQGRFWFLLLGRPRCSRQIVKCDRVSTRFSSLNMSTYAEPPERNQKLWIRSDQIGSDRIGQQDGTADWSVHWLGMRDIRGTIIHEMM